MRTVDNLNLKVTTTHICICKNSHSEMSYQSQRCCTAYYRMAIAIPKSCLSLCISVFCSTRHACKHTRRHTRTHIHTQKKKKNHQTPPTVCQTVRVGQEVQEIKMKEWERERKRMRDNCRSVKRETRELSPHRVEKKCTTLTQHVPIYFVLKVHFVRRAFYTGAQHTGKAADSAKPADRKVPSCSLNLPSEQTV